MNKFIKKVFNPHFREGFEELGGGLSLDKSRVMLRADDIEILRKDWETVGNDMRESINIYERRYIGSARGA